MTASSLANLAFAVQGGRIALDGKAGENLDLRLTARSVPLAAADIFVPGLGLSGTLEANATIAGTRDTPIGPFHVTVAHLSSAQMAGAGLPPVDAKLDGELADKRAKIDGRVDIRRYGAIELHGGLPLSAAGAVDLAATGHIDAAITDPLLGPAGRRLTGAEVCRPSCQGNSSQAGALREIELVARQLLRLPARRSAQRSSDHALRQQ